MRAGVWKAGVAAVCAAGLVITSAAGAQAASGGLRIVRVVTSSPIGPLQFAVGWKRVVVADSFTSTLSVVGRAKPLAVGPSAKAGGDLAGVAIDGRTGDVGYTTSKTGKSGELHVAATFTVLHHDAPVRTVDVFAYEKEHNPDGGVHYGIEHPTACQAASLKKIGVPASYTGQVDTHPYGVAAIGGGSWAIADAGGNDLLKVDPSGTVSTIAVLPPQPVVVTKQFVKANKGAACLVGATYDFESVPTDVEDAPGGGLLVTVLPGGPEGPDSGNPGSVYLVKDGQVTKVATGFASATNLAVTPSGHVYVAQLGSGAIAEIVNGAPQTVLTLPGVVGLEYAYGHLWASTAPAAVGGKGPGRVLELSAVG